MPRTYSFDHFTAVPAPLASKLPRPVMKERPHTQLSGGVPGQTHSETELYFHARQMLTELERLMKAGKRKKRVAGKKTVKRTRLAAKRSTKSASGRRKKSPAKR